MKRKIVGALLSLSLIIGNPIFMVEASEKSTADNKILELKMGKEYIEKAIDIKNLTLEDLKEEETQLALNKLSDLMEKSKVYTFKMKSADLTKGEKKYRDIEISFEGTIDQNEKKIDSKEYTVKLNGIETKEEFIYQEEVFNIIKVPFLTLKKNEEGVKKFIKGMKDKEGNMYFFLKDGTVEADFTGNFVFFNNDELNKNASREKLISGLIIIDKYNNLKKVIYTEEAGMNFLFMESDFEEIKEK